MAQQSQTSCQLQFPRSFFHNPNQPPNPAPISLFSTMKFPTTLLTFLLPLLISATPVPDTTNTNTTDALLAPPFVNIDSFIYSGTGCPPGSLDAYVSAGGAQIAVWYNQMVAFSPGDASANKRKFCQFNFKLHYPPGWAFTVVSNDYSGYIGIDGGLTAEVVSSYYYSGHSTGRSDPSSTLSVRGPFYQDYRLNSRTSTQVWSPCGAEVLLNLKTDIRLIGDGTGVISTDRSQTKFFNFVNLDWRNC